MNIKAIIFDFDDTLVKTHEIKWAHHKAVAKRFYNIELADETLRQHWGEPFDVLISNLYQQADTVEHMRAANRSLESEFKKPLFPSTLSVVASLHEANLPLSILSSTNRDFIVTDLEQRNFPLEKFFFIQGSETTTVHKPDPAVFAPTIALLQQKDISVRETVYVGDALMDCQAALAAGMQFIGVTTGLFSREELSAAGAELVIDDLGKLPDIIRCS